MSDPYAIDPIKAREIYELRLDLLSQTVADVARLYAQQSTRAYPWIQYLRSLNDSDSDEEDSEDEEEKLLSSLESKNMSEEHGVYSFGGSCSGDRDETRPSYVEEDEAGIQKPISHPNAKPTRPNFLGQKRRGASGIIEPKELEAEREREREREEKEKERKKKKRETPELKKKREKGERKEERKKEKEKKGEEKKEKERKEQVKREEESEECPYIVGDDIEDEEEEKREEEKRREREKQEEERRRREEEEKRKREEEEREEESGGYIMGDDDEEGSGYLVGDDVEEEKEKEREKEREEEDEDEGGGYILGDDEEEEKEREREKEKEREEEEEKEESGYIMGDDEENGYILGDDDTIGSSSSTSSSSSSSSFSSSSSSSSSFSSSSSSSSPSSSTSATSLSSSVPAKQQDITRPRSGVSPSSSLPSPSSLSSSSSPSISPTDRKKKKRKKVARTPSHSLNTSDRFSSTPTLSPEQDLHRDWNEQFQEVMKNITLLEKWESLQEKTELNSSLLQLIQDFQSVAKMYGRIIILERFLKTGDDAKKKYGPNWMEKKIVTKTIPPADLHGIAGGEKFIVNNIVFKFAVDTGLYGADHFAIKAAGLELLGLSAYFSTNTPGLHLPLCALVNFLGYRLMACSLLPIKSGKHGGDSTLVYGSQDGAKNMYNENEYFHQMATHVAEKLHLRSHLVRSRNPTGPNPGRKEVIVSAAFDVEGHLGTDGRFYFLDLARALPSDPIHLDDWFKGFRKIAPLVSRFRPEFMSAYYRVTGKCLTPDSPHEVPVGKDDPNQKEMYCDIRDAARYLKKEYIPEVIRVAINTFEMLRHSFPYTNHNQAKNTLLAMSQQQQWGSEGGGTGGTGGMRQTGRITSSGEGGFDVVSSLESSGFFGSRGSVESGPSSSSSSASSTSSSLTAVVSPYHAMDIPALMHGNGVNLRYLGFVLSYILSGNRNFLRNPDSYIPVAIFISVEAVARAMKNHLNTRFRTHMSRLSMSVEAPYRILLVNELNVFFRYDDDPVKRKETEENWFAIRSILQNTFGFIEDSLVETCLFLVRGTFAPRSFPQDELPGIKPLPTSVPIQKEVYTVKKVQNVLEHSDTQLRATPMYLLFNRLVQIMKLKFSEIGKSQFLANSAMMVETEVREGVFEFSQEAKVPFTLADLSKIQVKVKGMKIGMNAQANFYHSQAISMERRTGGESTALKHYALAESLYKEIISSHPQDAETQYNLCVTRYRALLLKKRLEMRLSHTDVKTSLLSLESADVVEMEQQLNMLKALADHDCRVRYLIGLFYFHAGAFSKAEYHTLKAIEFAPFCEKYMLLYSTILHSQPNHSWKKVAAVFQSRAKMMKKVLEGIRAVMRCVSGRQDSGAEIDAKLKELSSSLISPDIIESIAFGISSKQKLREMLDSLQFIELECPTAVNPPEETPPERQRFRGFSSLFSLRRKPK